MQSQKVISGFANLKRPGDHMVQAMDGLSQKILPI